MRRKLVLVALPLLLVACSSGEPAAEGQPSASVSAEASASPGDGAGEDSAAEEGAEPATEEGAEPATEEGAEPATEEGAEPATEEGAEPATEEGATSAASSRLEGVPEDFPAELPLPEGIARVSSSTSSGSGESKTWALSFGLTGSEWESPCTSYSGTLAKEGFESALREQSSQYVSETLVGQDLAISMACEQGRMVILVGPPI